MQGSDWAPEEEAEAALLALGPTLEWKGDRLRLRAIHGKGTGLYTVQPDTAGDFFFAMFQRDIAAVSYNPVMLATQEQAKAACERHHATGKW